MKTIHRAKMINDNGDVLPLCRPAPPPIDLTRETWTNRDKAVTCKKCLAALGSPIDPPAGEPG